jgi:ribosomal protein S18
MVEHRKRSLAYAGGRGPASEDIRMYSLSLVKNPVLTNVLNFLLNNYKPKYKDEFSYKNDIKRILEDGEIDMKTLKEFLEEYYEITHSRGTNLRDFAARNLLSEMGEKGEQKRLVIIDQHPHHR